MTEKKVVSIREAEELFTRLGVLNKTAKRAIRKIKKERMLKAEALQLLAKNIFNNGRVRETSQEARRAIRQGSGLEKEANILRESLGLKPLPYSDWSDLSP